MLGLIIVSLVAYTAVALLFKAAAVRTNSNRLVVVALATVALAAAVMMGYRGEWGGT